MNINTTKINKSNLSEIKDFMEYSTISENITYIEKYMQSLDQNSKIEIGDNFKESIFQPALDATLKLFDKYYIFYRRTGQEILQTFQLNENIILNKLIKGTILKDFEKEYYKKNHIGHGEKIFLLFLYLGIYYNIKGYLWKSKIKYFYEQNGLFENKIISHQEYETIKNKIHQSVAEIYGSMGEDDFTKNPEYNLFYNQLIQLIFSPLLDLKFISNSQNDNISNKKISGFINDLYFSLDKFRLKKTESAIIKLIKNKSARKQLFAEDFLNDGFGLIIEFNSLHKLKNKCREFITYLNNQIISIGDKGTFQEEELKSYSSKLKSNSNTIKGIIPFCNITTQLGEYHEENNDQITDHTIYGEWSFRLSDIAQFNWILDQMYSDKNKTIDISFQTIVINDYYKFWETMITQVYRFNHKYYKFTQNLDVCLTILDYESKDIINENKLQTFINENIQEIAENIYLDAQEFWQNNQKKIITQSNLFGDYLKNQNIYITGICSKTGDIDKQAKIKFKNIEIIKKVLNGLLNEKYKKQLTLMYQKQKSISVSFLNTISTLITLLSTDLN